MKILKLIFALIIITLTTQSCNEKNNDKNRKQNNINDTTKINKKQKNSDTLKITTKTDTIKKKKHKTENTHIYKYICPLNCKKGTSDTPGNCPECNMELIENPDYKTNNNKK